MSDSKNDPPGFLAKLELKVPLSATCISDAVRTLQNWVYYLDRLKAAGVRLVPCTDGRQDRITLITRNSDVARKYGFKPLPPEVHKVDTQIVQLQQEVKVPQHQVEEPNRHSRKYGTAPASWPARARTTIDTERDNAPKYFDVSRSDTFKETQMKDQAPITPKLSTTQIDECFAHMLRDPELFQFARDNLQPLDFNPVSESRVCIAVGGHPRSIKAEWGNTPRTRSCCMYRYGVENHQR